MRFVKIRRLHQDFDPLTFWDALTDSYLTHEQTDTGHHAGEWMSVGVSEFSLSLNCGPSVTVLTWLSLSQHTCTATTLIHSPAASLAHSHIRSPVSSVHESDNCQSQHLKYLNISSNFDLSHNFDLINQTFDTVWIFLCPLCPLTFHHNFSKEINYKSQKALVQILLPMMVVKLKVDFFAELVG